MNTKTKQAISIVLVALPMGLAIYWLVNRLFIVNEDADEGDHKWWSIFRFKKVEKYTINKNNINMDYKIQNIVAQLPKHPKKQYSKRSLSQITQAVIHHSATPMNAIGSRPQVYARYHIDNRGWAGIGYHFVIQPDGSIFQTNLLETVSNHVQNANTKSIGICLSGNFDTEKPTDAAYGAAVWLVKALNGQLGRELGIHAHNEYANKSCPGAAIDIKSFKDLVYPVA
jgi:N-acetylmuramoyl-L-alanine amidase